MYDMYDKWHLQSKPECGNNPWSAPGTAKIYGSCGTNGGNPNGCGQGEGQTNITNKHIISFQLYLACSKGNLYGNCCGGSCGGYEGGKSAIIHAAEGLFDGALIKEWTRGKDAFVYWKMGAEHRGGYAYRLCKV